MKHHLRISMTDKTFCGLAVKEGDSIQKTNANIKILMNIPENFRCKKCIKAIES